MKPMKPMKHKHWILAGLLVILLAACSKTAELPEGSVVLVEVDGVPVTLSMLERAMEGQGMSEDDHEGMRRLLDELIGMQAVANAARAEGLGQRKEVHAAVQLAELRTLYANYLSHALAAEPIADQDARQVYEAQLARSGDRQYRMAVIGWPSQAAALHALDRLESGEIHFDALAREARAAGQRVDEPNWIDRSQVPEDFSQALRAADEGGVIGAVLNDGPHWYVARLLQSRALEAPPFEQVRDGILQNLRQHQVQLLVETLKDQARIKPMLPLEEAGRGGS